MAKLKVDPQDVLRRLQAGENAESIARSYGVKGQAIRRWKVLFIKEGKLPPDIKPSQMGRPKTTHPQPKSPVAPMAKALEDAQTAIERATREIMTETISKMNLPALIEALHKAGEYPQVEAEMIKYRRGYQNLMDAQAAQNRNNKKKREQQQSGKLAYEQGEINPPLTSERND